MDKIQTNELPRPVIAEDLKDFAVFSAEVKKNVEGVINESIQLFNMDPRQYHPFYLRVFKYILIGQRYGHIPVGDEERLNFWKKYDDMAASRWVDVEFKSAPFSGEKSPYATYILTKQVCINGKIIVEKRNAKQRNREFVRLERIGKNILKEGSISSDIKEDLSTRLQFFKHCYTVAHPGDCVRMNRIWKRFCTNFRNEVKCSRAYNTIQTSGEHMNTEMILPKSEPISDEEVEFDLKFDIPSESETRAENLPEPRNSARIQKAKQEDEKFVKNVVAETVPKPKTTAEERKAISKLKTLPEKTDVTTEPKASTGKSKAISVLNASTKSAKVIPKPRTPTEKTRSVTITRTRSTDGRVELCKKLTKTLGKAKTVTKSITMITGGKTKTSRLKSSFHNRNISKARKIVKLSLAQSSYTSKKNQEKILSKLEKRISVIWRKRKVAVASDASQNPLSQDVCHDNPLNNVNTTNQTCDLEIAPVSKSESGSNLEYSMCDQCGQTYNTYYLKTHKENVHNEDNLGKPCPLCSEMFKGTQYLWSHFLSTHMPDQFNPTSRAQQAPVFFESMDVDESSELSPLPVPELPANEELPLIRHIPRKQAISPGPKRQKSWICTHCNNKSFSSKASLERHLYLVHGEGSLPENKLQCDECGKAFKEKAALTQHIKRVHQGIDNRCEICSRSFQTAGKLWKHKVDEHGIISDAPGSIQCEHCGEPVLQGKQYINHVKKQHPEMLEHALAQEKERRRELARETKKRSKQKMKEMGIKRKPEKKRKTVYHKNLPKKCPICEKVLQGNLPRHLQKFHGKGNGMKMYYCPQENCDKKYKSIMSLRIHITQYHDPVHEKITEKKLIQVVHEGSNKEFKCMVCGWKISNRHECMVHIVIGHPSCLDLEGVDNPISVKCPHCEETNKKKEEIIQHVEMCHPEKVWKCPELECGRSILDPVDLQEHFFRDHGTRGKEVLNLRKKRDRSNWRKRKGVDVVVGPLFKRGNGIFPCYRCDTAERSKEELDKHVKKVHPSAYWPCSGCGIVSFSERSRLFHWSVVCKIKGQKPENVVPEGMVGHDKITVQCLICDKSFSTSFYSRHLKVKHGIKENGELLICNFCNETGKGKMFKTREFWLAHMEDCHGDKINLDELIDVAGLINSTEELNIEALRKEWQQTAEKEDKRKRKFNKKLDDASNSRNDSDTERDTTRKKKNSGGAAKTKKLLRRKRK